MGNCCSSDNPDQNVSSANLRSIRATGNLDSAFVVKHGPRPTVAVQTNQAEEMSKIHEQMVEIGVEHKYEDYRQFGENIGPYMYNAEQTLYYGQYQLGKRQGLGILLDSREGYMYEGTFDNDVICGHGCMVTKDQDHFIGNFNDGEPHGECQLKHDDGYCYQGEWFEGQKHGFGKEIMPDKSEFSGQFVNGEREGKGVMQYDNSVFTGNFSSSRINGVGTMEFVDGRAYTGNLVDDQFNGLGVFTWPDGRKYDGEFIDGLKHGTGKFTDKNGNVWEGEFLNGKQNGRGKMTNKHGVVVQTGTWVNGVRVSEA